MVREVSLKVNCRVFWVGVGLAGRKVRIGSSGIVSVLEEIVQFRSTAVVPVLKHLAVAPT